MLLFSNELSLQAGIDNLLTVGVKNRIAVFVDSRLILEAFRIAFAPVVTVIHWSRVSDPSDANGCFFGIDFPDPAQLIANSRSVDEIRDFLGVDSLGYISVDGLLEAVGGTADEYCTACFTGEYPCRVDDEDMDKHAMERRS